MAAAQSRKWMILVATIWIQSFTGTNFDFSAYSTEMKAVLGVSQVQLNYLATASDLGKAIGWSSGIAIRSMRIETTMFIAAGMGLVGYGVQWLVITNVITLPYFAVFLMCFLSGLSICWFNTVCFVLCIRNFPLTRPLALSLTTSFNGLSPALYNLIVTSISTSSSSIYLLLNSLIPLITSIIALTPILRQPPHVRIDPEAAKHNQLTFLMLNLLAIVTGLYLLFLHPTQPYMSTILFVGAMFLLVIPLGIPGVIYGWDWFKRTLYSSFRIDGSGFILVDDENLELHKEFISHEESFDDSVSVLGHEHDLCMLVGSLDFWLYYVSYLCGGTIGLVYSNNLGQIAQSLGHASYNSILITIYSSFSFFGRLLSAAPDFVRMKLYFARTGWLAIALIPTPIALFLVTALGDNLMAIEAATAMIGLSSGFIFAAAVSITSELFGPESASVNHNILITNIPIGSLVYGFVAAMVYDWNARTMSWGRGGDMVVCMGRKCYFETFLGWGCVSVFGLSSCLLLFFRTRGAYASFEQSRRRYGKNGSLEEEEMDHD